MQILVYTSQPPGSSPHPFRDTRQDVTFFMHYERGKKPDMKLALSGLRVFENQVRLWGAQELVIGLGKARVLMAGLGVRFAKEAVEKDGLAFSEGGGQGGGGFGAA